MTASRILDAGVGAVGYLAIGLIGMACGNGPDRNGSVDGGDQADGGQADGGQADSGQCGGAPGATTPVPRGGMDPAPVIDFTQVGKSVGIDRKNEPSSAGAFDVTNDGISPAYGSWLADFDGDGRLDYFGVNHSQTPHLSGLFVNTGTGAFGKNLFTVSFQEAPGRDPRLDLTNEVRFVGDITGDGKVDLYFISWSGMGAICVNQGVATHADWSGPGHLCYGSTDGLAFADVNGDGKLDVLTFDVKGFDSYVAYYSQTAPYVWLLNNGDPDIAKWSPETDFLKLRVIDPAQVAAPFVDLNNDGVPDKIVGIPLPEGQRGQNATEVGGQRVFIGQAATETQPGTYIELTATGLESAHDPITRLEDVDGNGCIDVGTDNSGYRDNQIWYLQSKAGAECTLTFTKIARTALPYYPGFKRYDVDLDNSGLLSKVVLVHTAYGNSDGRAAGATIFHKQANGSYVEISPGSHGVDITGGDSEFYADNLSPGDWNDDGKLDLAGSGNPTIAGSDKGFALWTSDLATTNGWIKVTLPSVTGFFTGAATIEVFDACAAGDPTHLVTPAKVLYTGKAWASQSYHFGIGTRSSVDVRVTFPDGHQVTRAGVAPNSRLKIDR